MKEFRECFREQMRRHPSMQVQDAVKLCYQAVFGAAHLMENKTAAMEALESEFFLTAPDETVPLYEDIGGGHARVNIARWRAEGRGFEELLWRFLVPAKEVMIGDIEPFLVIAFEEWQDKAAFERFVAEWKARGCPPLHHSDVYREKEKPSYRVIKKDV